MADKYTKLSGKPFVPSPALFFKGFRYDIPLGPQTLDGKRIHVCSVRLTTAGLGAATHPALASWPPDEDITIVSHLT